jgi:hypothetical protein
MLKKTAVKCDTLQGIFQTLLLQHEDSLWRFIGAQHELLKS